jgi:F0F1-type ATP synthase membrane subunit b/b'
MHKRKKAVIKQRISWTAIPLVAFSAIGVAMRMAGKKNGKYKADLEKAGDKIREAAEETRDDLSKLVEDVKSEGKEQAEKKINRAIDKAKLRLDQIGMSLKKNLKKAKLDPAITEKIPMRSGSNIPGADLGKHKSE